MKAMKGMQALGASIRCLLIVAAVVAGPASAQAAAACKIVSNGNTTMFERMVAERLDAGWVVKGGLYKDNFGFAVLMCSR